MDNASMTMSVNQSNYPPDTYEIVILGTEDNNPANTVSHSFEMNVVHPCSSSVMQISQVASVDLSTDGDVILLQLEVTDSVSVSRGDTDGEVFCGLKTYRLKTAYEFLELGQDGTIQMSSKDLTLAGSE